MSSLLIFWISIGIGFLIIEMITVTFYGLAIAVASFIVAGYVWYTGALDMDTIQAVIFAIASFLAAYFIPQLLMPRGSGKTQWLDIYLGEKRKVKKVGDDYKVTLDGVAYLVDIDGVQSGDKVELTSRDGSTFSGNIIK